LFRPVEKEVHDHLLICGAQERGQAGFCGLIRAIPRTGMRDPQKPSQTPAMGKMSSSLLQGGLKMADMEEE
jgi:hypothetical protein